VLGAHAQKIEIEFDRNTDFTKYRAFAITDANLNSRNPSLNSELCADVWMMTFRNI
jgi:hypothetical protein